MNARTAPAVTPASPARSYRGLFIGLLLASVLVSAVVLIGIARFSAEVKGVEQEHLLLIGRIKAAELARWVEQKKIYLDQPVDGLFARTFRARGAARSRLMDESRGRLSHLLGLSEEHRSVWLSDAQGTPLLHAGQPPPPARVIEAARLQAVSSGKAALIDFFVPPSENAESQLGLLMPLFDDNGPGVPPSGFVGVLFDPAERVFPIIQSWPDNSRSGEALLFRVENENIVFLSKLRFQASPALSERRPLNQVLLVSARAIRDNQEVLEGVDYRQNDVTAAVIRVTNTPWYLIAKKDRAEIEIESRHNAVRVLLALAVVLAGSWGVALQQRRRQFAREREASLQAELERLRLSKRLDMMIRYAHDIVLLLDFSGHIIDANDAALTAYGYTRDELLQLTIRALRPVEMQGEVDLQLRRAARPEGVSFETLHRRKDGGVFPVEVSSRSFEVEGQRYRQSIIRDISERKQAQARLESSEALYRLLAENITDVIWVLDVDTQRFNYVSNSVERLRGFTPAEVMAEDMGQAMTADSLVQVQEAMSAHLQEFQQGIDRSYLNEVEQPCRHGGTVWTEVTTRFRRDPESGHILVYGVTRDITERRLAEQALRENLAQLKRLNQRLEEAQGQLLQSEKMAAIGQLAAGVAHELNNPISFILSNLGTLEDYLGDLLEILRTYAQGDLDPSARDNASAQAVALKKKLDFDFLIADLTTLTVESRDGLQRVRNIVKSLKDFSHVGDTDWQWADLHEGLDSTLTIVWNELKYKCEISKDYGSLPQVYCLPSQLNQVFMNLLINASHAIAERGIIRLRTRATDSEVSIEVEDNGCGIPAASLNRIFEPFYTTKPVGKGTGLGLSLAWSIVQRHGGRIEVDSVVGQGTTFRVCLPVRPSAAIIAAAAIPVGSDV